jgi:hypothetical protein
MRRPAAPTWWPSTVVVLALLLGASGCSGGDEEASRRAATEAVDREVARNSLAGMFAGDQPDAQGRAEGRCFADRLLDEVTPEDLQEHGVLDEDHGPAAGHGSLPEELATPWAEAQLACVSFYEASTRAQRAATKGRLDEAAYRSCLEAAVDEAEAVAGTAAALRGDWDDRALEELSRAQSSCASETAPQR